MTLFQHIYQAIVRQSIQDALMINIYSVFLLHYLMAHFQRYNHSMLQKSLIQIVVSLSYLCRIFLQGARQFEILVAHSRFIPIILSQRSQRAEMV